MALPENGYRCKTGSARPTEANEATVRAYNVSNEEVR
jgi:hypothetical protein